MCGSLVCGEAQGSSVCRPVFRFGVRRMRFLHETVISWDGQMASSRLKPESLCIVCGLTAVVNKLRGGEVQSSRSRCRCCEVVFVEVKARARMRRLDHQTACCLPRKSLCSVGVLGTYFMDKARYRDKRHVPNSKLYGADSGSPRQTFTALGYPKLKRMRSL